MVPLRFAAFQSVPGHDSAGRLDTDFKHVAGLDPCQARQENMADLENFEKLVEIMDRLRDPDGCPWDREQDYDSLRGYLLEEAYEVAEALDGGAPAAVCEELGDLLFQIVFLSRIAKERGEFTVADVIRGIGEKMIRRHPHVFGDAVAETSAEVLTRWEEIKRQEKPDPRVASALDGIPAGLPALLRAQRLGAKAARVGFDWERPADILVKIEEELAELREAFSRGEKAALRDELGDVLFALSMLARRLEIDPEGALQGSNLKFQRRFAWIEAELRRQGRSVEKAGLERLEALWQRAKSEMDPP